MNLAETFLRGSYIPLVTPFRDGEIDYSSFGSLVANQIMHDTHGIVVTGTTGESNALTIEERKRLLEVAVDVAKKRLVVVAATGSGSFADTVALSEHAEATGADALLVIPPPYLKPPQRGLADYYIALGRATSLPFLINNNPGRTAATLKLETLERIAEATPTFVGIDHAVADFGFVARLIERMGPDFRIFSGFEDMGFPMLMIGAAGVMNAVGNIAPRRIERLYTLTVNGSFDEARKMHYGLAELNASIYYDSNPIPIKYMMRKLGLMTLNEHRLPMAPATPELEATLDGVLERAGLIDDSAD